MPQKSEYPTKASPGKDQKSSTPVGHSNQKKTRVMVARSNKDGDEAFKCVNVEKPRSSGNSKKVIHTDQLVKVRQYTVLLAVPKVMMVRSTLK